MTQETETTRRAATSPRGELLTVKKAGEYLGAGERFARRLVAERRVPVIRLGRLVRISTSDLDLFIEANRSEPVTDMGRAGRQ